MAKQWKQIPFQKNGRSLKSHMSKMNKNILFLTCSLLFATIINAQVWDCDDEGDNLRAKLEDGTLIIRGSGMKNYQFGFSGGKPNWCESSIRVLITVC